METVAVERTLLEAVGLTGFRMLPPHIVHSVQIFFSLPRLPSKNSFFNLHKPKITHKLLPVTIVEAAYLQTNWCASCKSKKGTAFVLCVEISFSEKHRFPK